MAKAKAFSAPTIHQVSAFMSYEKPEWPKSFCDWYAEKFWNTYQEGGWKLSRGIAMKDWHAAFKARWKELKYDDVKNKLSECLKLDATRPKQTQMDYNARQAEEKPPLDPNAVWNYLDDILGLYRANRDHPTQPKLRETMSGLYKWLTSEKILRFTAEEKEKLVKDASNDKAYGRYLAVKLLFDKLITNNQTFKNAYAAVLAPKHEAD